MLNTYYQSIEMEAEGFSVSLHKALSNLSFNDQGLIPVITQDAKTRTVLMMAWMNRAAIDETLKTGRMTYWSRSRGSFWVKGETSGHVQELVRMNIDCDGDTLLCEVLQMGAACHTGRPSCFYWGVDTENSSARINAKPVSEKS